MDKKEHWKAEAAGFQCQLVLYGSYILCPKPVWCEGDLSQKNNNNKKSKGITGLRVGPSRRYSKNIPILSLNSNSGQFS